jgi:sortase A
MNIVSRLLVIIGALTSLSLVLLLNPVVEKQRPVVERSVILLSAKQEKSNVKVSSRPRLVIPKIKVDARVVEGVTWNDLAKGPGHVPSSDGPGKGNYAIAGHRNVSGAWFRYLPRLKIGDQILVYANGSVYKYRVYETRWVLPNEMWVLDPVPGKTVITLITCIPVPKPTHRFVVFGELISDRTSSAKLKEVAISS